MSFYEIWWRNIRCAACILMCFGTLALAGVLTAMACMAFAVDPAVTMVLSALAGVVAGVTILSVREWRHRKQSDEVEACLRRAFKKAK